MSLNSESSPQLFFQSVNGYKLKLIDKSIATKNVMKFILYRNPHLNINVTFLLIFATLLLWNTFNILISFIILILVLTIQLIHFITSVEKDTLLVIESIGIYIEGKRVFYGLSSSTFVPWDTLVDVFINEVIKGQKVLYYLTIIVREPFGRKNSLKLVPLFQELIPE